MQHRSFDISTLENYQTTPALFFTNEGILVDASTLSPCLPIQKTLDDLAIIIETAFFCQPVIILKSRFEITENTLEALNYKLFPIRAFLIQASAEQQSLILKAYHWLNWDSVSRFCGQCAGPLEHKFDHPEKLCLHCNRSFFPKFSPAVMVLIHRENEILLARSHHFRPNLYSAIAGFVDIGESAEMAVHREVKEELGIEIDNLQYFSSQTWPFPDSFMIAFNATYKSGELMVDKQELEDAAWFNINHLPLLPPLPSISRLLIDHSVQIMR